MVKKFLKPAVFFLVALATQIPAASALSAAQKQLFDSGIYYYNIDASSSTCTPSGPAPGQPSNTDYAGRPILNDGELKAEAANQAVYQQAASQADIPWQVIAAIHYREHGFSRNEPESNTTDGVYQILTGNYPDGTPYKTPGAYPDTPNAPLTDAQFLTQTQDAAKFIKAKLPSLTAQSLSPDIKNVLGLYNGLPQLYQTQAINLGFSGDQAYEGSPYVMNFADAKRDPGVAAAGTWLQYGTGPQGSIGNASQQRGGFLVYTSVSGISVSGGSCVGGNNCQNGTNATQGLSQVRQDVVCIAQAEYAKWQNGQLKPGSGYKIYSQNVPQDWCADFASWVYDQAKYPLEGDPNWRVAAVGQIVTIGKQNQTFHYHARSGYTPQPGDLAIHTDASGNDFHVNIVVGVSGGKVTLIGGNQGSNDFNQSKVSQDLGADDISGYVSPD